jgi:hypothetical protein
MPKASFSDETPLLVTMMEEVSQHSLLGGQTHVQGDAVVKLRKTFLLFFIFSLLVLGFVPILPKKKMCPISLYLYQFQYSFFLLLFISFLMSF